eukprot:GILK01005989.1.p1 GENE.GILK01005989.1~~GILK01005989.1.p1  ORF type:complete len:622 (-),score=56.34 GILK01005989.1:74-1660(-)
MKDEPFDLQRAYGIVADSPSHPVTLRLWRLQQVVNHLVTSLGDGADWIGIYRVCTDPSGNLSLMKESYRGEASRALFPLTAEFARKSNNSTVAMYAKGAIISDTTDIDAESPYYKCSPKVRSELCLPILNSRGHVLGIIDVESWRPNFFTLQKVLPVLLVCMDLGSTNLLIDATVPLTVETFEPLLKPLAPRNHAVPVFGTMTIGSQTDQATAESMIDSLMNQLQNVYPSQPLFLDTARIYCGGKTETVLGAVLKRVDRSKFYLATKVHPWETEGPVKGWHPDGLTPQRMRQQFTESLQALQMEYVDLLYLHCPDPVSSLEDSLQQINEFYLEGKFKEFGLSNYAAWEVAHIWHLCDKRGWIKPTVYQGMYNAITRDVERELIPCLKRLRIRFYCYNPLAAGILTGKHVKHAEPEEGRFKNNKAYQDRFWKDSYFVGVDLIRAACDTANISMANASIRWLVYHSDISKSYTSQQNGVIIGASTLHHLEDNIRAWTSACDARELPLEVVRAFDDAWECCKHECPKYFRP